MYTPRNKIRIVTAASLFDGHDASVNIMRRIMQASGAEIIHLGHNRSAAEIVECAVQEDVQAVAITSYQGGHIEFFRYIYDLLKEKGHSHIKIFGGGGGTILPSEIEELHAYGIARIFSPDDGRRMGLQGMIDFLLEQSDFPVTAHRNLIVRPDKSDKGTIASFISAAENGIEISNLLSPGNVPVLGITGTGGSGKSSLTDELVRRFIQNHPEKHVAIVSVDPTRRKTGGALLGDRIRMNSVFHPNIYMRSMATRETNAAVSPFVSASIDILKTAEFDLIIIETSGIGQSDSSVSDISDISLYVMTSEYGAASQLEKIDMLDFADVVAINKSDKRGAEDALKDVKKQFRRNRNMWEAAESEIPVFATIASQFNDPGINNLYLQIENLLNLKFRDKFHKDRSEELKISDRITIIPPHRERYLAEIAEANDTFNEFIKKQKDLASGLWCLTRSAEIVPENLKGALIQEINKIRASLDKETLKKIDEWPETVKKYQAEKFVYQVRDTAFETDLKFTTLSQLSVQKISVPKYSDWGDIAEWHYKENLPGEFPYTAGVFPFKRQNEDPTRMFAGEGGPERTNRRFHYLSEGQPAKRLSTAFDSVTLYGENPDHRPDIYGKIGNSGVSVATLDDAKKLYSGFDLCDPATSVSMTINGPAPMLLSFFLNAAIDQQCEKYLKDTGRMEDTRIKIRSLLGDFAPQYKGNLPEGNNGLGLDLLGIPGNLVLEEEVYQKIKSAALKSVRGTVQADILKEDQAQNTCIFSTDFALKMMGDIQEYFIQQQVRNFYSVSISGYHIAEAGANPVTQLAFTLANGFTYIEYYLARGMKIDEFAPNFSFFFSNGLDPEYSVLGRVARRIWAKAIRNKYNGNDRSQKLKYHIQTSGRSLHAQEIAFNDIRTTLQALYAIYDNCNSLHTNAYDEAITTPTEESVRRAMAIQLIINKELGLSKNENPLQGSFIIEELTDLVEEAVMQEFRRISDRGGVPGAMERMYQRSKIQEESLYYESLKHSGQLPLVGVNTFLSPDGSPTILPKEVIRSSTEEKENAIRSLENFMQFNKTRSTEILKSVQQTASHNGNIFSILMEAGKYCSLGQITHALYEAGGQYRRSM
jgi:isobutyryl-CoA mutase